MVNNGLLDRRPRFDPWVRKIPWRKEWQLTPIILAWRVLLTEEPGGDSPWGLRE